MKTARTILIVLFLLTITNCQSARPQAAALILPGANGPQAWIDAPLDGMHLPLAPYEIVLHASDAAGVTQVELSMNGVTLVALTNPDPGKKLVTFRYVWTPQSPGEYILRVSAQNGANNWGDYSSVRVFVGEPSSTVGAVTETPVITPTFTPTISATPTPTPTPTLTPTPTPGELTFVPRSSTTQFFYGGCSPTSVDLSVQVSGGEAHSVVLFLHLVDGTGGGSTDWNSYAAMSPQGNGGFSTTVVSTAIPGYNSFSSAWMAYQFVATDLGGNVVGRSSTFQDIALSVCGGQVITPTAGAVVPTLPIILPTIRPPVLLPSPTPTWPIIK